MATQTTTQAPKFPEELRPYIEEALKGSQDIFKGQTPEGMQEYKSFGDRLAAIPPELRAALQAQMGTMDLSQIAGGEGGLAGIASALQGEASDLTKLGGAAITPEMIDQYTNKYKQGVTDIAVRKAREEASRQQMTREGEAAKAGAFGGNRRFLLEGMAQGNLLEKVGDLQAKGSAEAYDAAMKRAEALRGRQLRGGEMLSSIGQRRTKGIQAGLESAEGAAGRSRALDQERIDENIAEFKREKAHGPEMIARYIANIRGSQPNIYGEEKRTQSRYSPFEKATGYASSFGTLFGGLGKLFGSFGNAEGGPIQRMAFGGPAQKGYVEDVGQQGGLMSIAGPTMQFAQGKDVTFFDKIKDYFTSSFSPVTRDIEGEQQAIRSSIGTIQDKKIREQQELELLKRDEEYKYKKKLDTIKGRIGNIDKLLSKGKLTDFMRNRLLGEKKDLNANLNKLVKTEKPKHLQTTTLADKRGEAFDVAVTEQFSPESQMAVQDQRLRLLKQKQDKEKFEKSKADERYKKYLEQVQSDRRYDAWFKVMEAVRQLPLSVKSDPIAIGKKTAGIDRPLSREEFDKYGSQKTLDRSLIASQVYANLNKSKGSRLKLQQDAQKHLGTLNAKYTKMAVDMVMGKMENQNLSEAELMRKVVQAAISLKREFKL